MFFRRAIVSGWFPKFDPVSLGVIDPSELPVACILDLGLYSNSFSLELVEGASKVFHSIVDHDLLLSSAKIFTVGRKQGPYRMTLPLWFR